MRVGTFPAPWGVQTSTERSEVGANTPLLRSRRQTPLWRLSACTGEVYSCYTDTYNRYRDYADKMDAAFADIELLKKVVTEHSEKLQKLA